MEFDALGTSLTLSLNGNVIGWHALRSSAAHNAARLAGGSPAVDSVVYPRSYIRRLVRATGQAKARK